MVAVDRGGFGNTELTDLEGLQGLTAIGRSLYIAASPKLANLGGLGNLVSIGEDLQIGESQMSYYVPPKVPSPDNPAPGDTPESPPETGNASLIDLAGLDSLTHIGGNITILENPALTDLEGLGGITSIEGSIRIEINPMLRNLNGLNNLESIGDGLEIDGNLALTGLDGLQNLGSVEGSIRIRRNAALPSCEAESLKDRLIDFTGEATICENLADACGSEPCE